MNKQTTFYHILGNNLLAGITNNLVWFALTFWVYIETQSVLATSWIAGTFAIAGVFGGFIFGPIVDRERKKSALIQSSIMSLIAYSIGALIYFSYPETTWQEPFSPILWTLIVVLMLGVVANNLRMIAQSTIVTMLFDDNRDKANGLVGASMGLSFAITSVFSGLIIGFFGMGTAIVVAIIATLVALLHLVFIALPEKEIVHLEDKPKRIDIKGSYILAAAVPGLIGIIIFNTFNNFLGGVFMALMDPYGLSLVSVQTWGLLWGAVSVASIGGSIYVSMRGVGKHPMRLIMILNIVMWAVCLIFPLQPLVSLLLIGMLTWMIFFPVIEAAEQTVMQSVVPFEQQGRVFGFAQSIENMATPVTTFMIGPIASFIFIPFMTTGSGAALIGNWFGAGADRGMALVFILAGFLGIIATLIAWGSRSYKLLSGHYQKA
ncbi:MFS transporter [Patescibacteria group bacterium]|nr:MFS transporter [Patescibacteria group bacterium]